jgi:hypothetical protein
MNAKSTATTASGVMSVEKIEGNSGQISERKGKHSEIASGTMAEETVEGGTKAVPLPLSGIVNFSP